ncbi:hypothetical protein STEG23_036186, partial [Scotinomys teguina]
RATVCMVCKSFKRGHCLVGKSNCTTQYRPGCRTRNFFIFSQTEAGIFCEWSPTPSCPALTQPAARVNSGAMENLPKLCLFILSFETALALQCKECSSYSHKKCKYGMKACTANYSESCMITRIWTLPGSANDPTDGYSGCQKNCKISDYDYGDYSVLTTCCDAYDFCNDIHVPIDEWY